MKISVIVPVYNVENYLRVCVDSILASTYSNFELILVDDGSTDSSGGICDKYATCDPRVIVIHKENEGQAISRNRGLDKSSGGLISFVDADDVIAPTMLQMLLDALVSNPDCDFTMGRATTIYDDSKLDLDAVSGKTPTIVEYGQKKYMSYLFKDNLFGYPVVWCKLYRREFIGDERFKSIDAEDIEWLTRLCIKMKKAVVVEQKLYGYRVRSNSITHDNGSINGTVVGRLNTYLMCLNDLPEQYTTYRSWCLLYTYKMMLNTRYKAHNTEFYPEVISRNSHIYNQTVDELMHCELKWPVRMALYAFYHMPWLYAIVYWVYAKLYAVTH